jgi:hypothetical protein
MSDSQAAVVLMALRCGQDVDLDWYLEGLQGDCDSFATEWRADLQQQAPLLVDQTHGCCVRNHVFNSSAYTHLFACRR